MPILNDGTDFLKTHCRNEIYTSRPFFETRLKITLSCGLEQKVMIYDNEEKMKAIWLPDVTDTITPQPFCKAGFDNDAKPSGLKQRRPDGDAEHLVALVVERFV